MSKYTTTLYEYIHSELRLAGHSEFLNDNRLTFFDDEYAFIQKVMKYDEDVQNIVNSKLFKNFKFSDESVEFDFKQAFVTRFLDREIGRQTIEGFASQLISVILQHYEYILMTFQNLNKYFSGESTQEYEDTENGSNTDEHREATSTLPQTEVNINVDHDELDFADENTIQKDKHENNNERKGNSKSNTFNPDTLAKLFDAKEKIFEEIDRKCFLQVW